MHTYWVSMGIKTEAEVNIFNEDARMMQSWYLQVLMIG